MNAAAGLSGQFVTYPLDVVRRRMQLVGHSIAPSASAGAGVGVSRVMGMTEGGKPMRMLQVCVSLCFSLRACLYVSASVCMCVCVSPSHSY